MICHAISKYTNVIKYYTGRELCERECDQLLYRIINQVYSRNPAILILLPPLLILFYSSQEK